MSLFDDASLVLTPNGYKASKLYSIKPTSGLGDMTVVRATTTATRVNSAGFIESVAINVPRLDYPLLGGGCPKILVEPLRTNRLLRSEEFNLTWIPILANVTTNTTTAPDNTMTADKLVATAVPGTHFILQVAAGAVNGTTVTASVFVKASGLSNIQLFNNATGDGQVNFILSGAGSYTVVTGVSANIENYGNGWYRCIMVYTPTTTGNFNVQIRLADSSGNISFTGNGVNGVSLWGAQIEEGTKPTSYIPTTTAAVTRNADVISKTGISSLIGQTEGTIFVEANLTANTDQRRIITIGTEFQRIMFWTLGTTLYANFNGVAIAIGTFPIGTAKMALGYTIAGGSTTYSIKVNNNTLITGTAAAAPSSLSVINLGNSANGTLILNDRIELATLFQTRLTNAQLATLTTL
jgi:hypothetical protein